MIPSSRNVLRQYALTDNRHKRFLEGYGKLAQAMQVGTDPDSPVVFNLRLGDGMVEGGAVEVLASEALTAPLVAFSGSDDADSPV